MDAVICGVRVENDGSVSPEGEAVPPLHHSRYRRILAEYQAICALAGVVFPIVSGYRSPIWQTHHYTPERNGHCLGYALDIAPVGDWTIGQMSAVAKIRWITEGSYLRGVGMYPHWLCIDVRPRFGRRSWIGSAHLPD